jgi:hypothetical protein
MRVWGILFGLCLPGCLYVGSVNRAPRASLALTNPPAMLIKGQPLTVAGKLSDPEDGSNLVPFWDVALADGSQGPCDYELIYDSQVVDGQPTAVVTFFRTGDWVISIHTFDKLDAPSNTDHVMVTVSDAPPSFSGGDTLSAQANIDAECQTYTAGEVLPLYLSGMVVDPDAVVFPAINCDPTEYNETLRYRWEVTGLPATSHAVIGPKPSKGSTPAGDADCPPSPAPGLAATWQPGSGDFPTAACFYPDVGSDPVPSMYQITLYVSDGNTEIHATTFMAPVRSDLPPCLTGAAPEPGSYVVDRNATQEFAVTGAIDDRDPFGSSGLGFVWSIWREEDPTWRTVPDWSLPSYALDTSGFSVGEKVRVRVVPADRLGARASCNVDDDTCTVMSCITGTSLCQTWMTWDLELR